MVSYLRESIPTLRAEYLLPNLHSPVYRNDTFAGGRKPFSYRVDTKRDVRDEHILREIGEGLFLERVTCPTDL